MVNNNQSITVNLFKFSTDIYFIIHVFFSHKIS